MVRKSTWEACFKHPKASALPSNWRELGVFCLLLGRVAPVTGTMWSLQKEMPASVFLHSPRVWGGPVSLSEFLSHVTLRARQWRPLPPTLFPLHPTWQLGTFSISSLGKAGNCLFSWNEHDPEKHWACSGCTWKRPQLDFPSHSVGAPIYWSTVDTAFQASSNRSLAPTHHNNWLVLVYRKSEKFTSYQLPEVLE